MEYIHFLEHASRFSRNSTHTNKDIVSDDKKIQFRDDKKIQYWYSSDVHTGTGQIHKAYAM